MRLINVHTFRFEEIDDCTQVKYAILSHRWGEQEVHYKDVIRIDGNVNQLVAMKGFYKIARSCQEAAQRGYHYVWVDTCCIDKSSSAELQEAINSMFRWYACAEVCFAYLSDVQWAIDETSFDRSRWFERGWTLQELLAPRHLVFFDAMWQRIDSRNTMAARVSTITGIPEKILCNRFKANGKLKSRPCVAAIMSWASRRKTTRPEDRAYSLLGLFDINMPTIYGEGSKAFHRLQIELLRQNEDQSIFAWDSYGESSVGLLAKSPENFRPTPATALLAHSYSLERRLSSQVSSEGVHLEVQLVPVCGRVYMALFNLTIFGADETVWLGPGFAWEANGLVGVYVSRLDDQNRFARISSPFLNSKSDLVHWPCFHPVSQLRTITVVQRIHPHEVLGTGLSTHLKIDTNKLSNESCSDEINLGVLLGPRNLWSEWVKSEDMEATGLHCDERILRVNQWSFNEEDFKIHLLGSAAFALINNNGLRSCPFGSLLIGFDFESTFMCCVSMCTQKQELIHRFGKLLCLPDEKFNYREPSDEDLFRVTSCKLGRYHIFDEKMVVFKKKREKHGGPMDIKIHTRTGARVHLSVDTLNSRWFIFVDVEYLSS